MHAHPQSGPLPGPDRGRVAGKFLFAGNQKLWLRGVTYGTFADEYGSPQQVARDFAAMAAHGVNAVRTYTVPPRRILDAALEHGLWITAGLPWEQHVAFLDDRGRAASIRDRVRAGVAAVAGHPALLAVAIGNEIPAPIVRWHGRRRVEAFLDELCVTVRAEDPGALVTYANYPSTEYLRVGGVDFSSFNVYLEDGERLEAYLARLHNLAPSVPLVVSEVGLDSRRNGLARQGRTVADQVRRAFRTGCAGTFVFAWTDEWHRGGHDVLDWDFGLTDRRRRPKPALPSVARVYEQVPPAAAVSPRVSVIVCTYNGAPTLRECLTGATALDYPDYEVIVVDDGSTDLSPAIASQFPVRLVRTPNRGLSAARNTGLAAATGEIVAYLDDDAYPDPDWLTFIVAAFETSDHAGVGGPNVAPPDETPFGTCVANAPGGPVHVLLSDTVAEHIPGCNMAFRRALLLDAGGFDEQFRVAGDDVDVCWKLQEAGHTLGFHPAALVWHRRRTTLRRFWRQQRGYGRAEALLERKWPQKYDTRGHLSWRGRVYAPAGAATPRRTRVYHGTWGSEPYQSEVLDLPPVWMQLAGTPEWYLLLAGLAGVSAMAPLWAPLAAVVPVLVLATLATLVPAVRGARRAPLRRGLRPVVAALHVLQPLARLTGRLSLGLSPWRRLRAAGFAAPWPRKLALWFERPRAGEERLRALETLLRGAGTRVQRGGAFDRWDLEVGAGMLAAVRLRAALEEHGDGRQLLRVRAWPRVATPVVVLAVGLAGLAAAALGSGATAAAAIMLAAEGVVAAGALVGCGGAKATVLVGLAALEREGAR